MGMLEVIDGVTLVDTDQRPFVPIGYKFKSQVSCGKIPLDVEHIALWSPVHECGSEMRGLQVLAFLASKRLANSNVLQALLYGDVAKIPDCWKGKRIYFLGTEYEIHGHQCVRVAYHHPKTGWTWAMEHLSFLWDEDCVAALLEL